jgi:hypothetical protein
MRCYPLSVLSGHRPKSGGVLGAAESLHGSPARRPAKNLTEILHLSYDFSPLACHTPSVQRRGRVP